MTRNEYLNDLKYELRNLPVEEQEDALEFYRGYFEDAENDEQVMQEFGSPKELAASIIEKFASVPEVRKPQKNKSQNGSYGQFDDTEIRSLDISLGAAEIVLTQGEKFSVDYRGLDIGEVVCSVSPFGTLTIENISHLPKFRNFSIWSHHSHESSVTAHPRILIKIPDGTKFDLVRIHVGAGDFRMKNLRITTSRSYIDVGAGNLVLNNIHSGETAFRCGMGNITYTGTVAEQVNVDCGMGNISLNLEGEPDHYSITAKVGLGSVRFNNIKKDGVGAIDCTEKKQNHFSVNCGIGCVHIKMTPSKSE